MFGTFELVASVGRTKNLIGSITSVVVFLTSTPYAPNLASSGTLMVNISPSRHHQDRPHRSELLRSHIETAMFSAERTANTDEAMRQSDWDAYKLLKGAAGSLYRKDIKGRPEYKRLEEYLRALILHIHHNLRPDIQAAC